MLKNPVKFRNFSDEDFSWNLDGQVFNFPAGSVSDMEGFEHEHFSRHLIDREITKIQDAQRREQLAAGKKENELKTIRTDDVAKRAEFMSLCSPEPKEPKVEQEEPKKDKKEKTKKDKKKKANQLDEDEFEGLKE